ncbi:hypothetical protein TWF481_003415 [Arthrobotrys musiformis]|uniref:Uncharacterized protein n=1 Tax=Arthrobotrys musiformis TaxID=47236 RepID=A0AAV9VRE9_9PEZI
MSSSSNATEKIQKTYHIKATGDALLTVEKHSHDAQLKLYGGCFCPFVQVNHIQLSLPVAIIGSRSSKLTPSPPKASLDRLGAFGCLGGNTMQMILINGANDTRR